MVKKRKKGKEFNPLSTKVLKLRQAVLLNKTVSINVVPNLITTLHWEMADMCACNLSSICACGSNQSFRVKRGCKTPFGAEQ